MPPVTRRELIGLAVPAAASALLNNAFRVIDQHAAGSIGPTAQAAIGSCTFVFIAIYGLQVLVASGAGPLLARATGAQDPKLRREAWANALTLSVALMAVLAVLGWFASPSVVGLLGLRDQTAVDAVDFLQMIFLGSLPGALLPLCDAAFVALGRPRRMMLLQGLAAGLNAALNPIFIHQLGLGVVGAALATSLGKALAAAIGLYTLSSIMGLTRADFRSQPALMWRMLRVGLPASAGVVAYALVYWALLGAVISPLGLNAALGIGFSALEGVSYPLFLGISMGVSSVVGRRLGAGEPDEAARAGRLGTPMALGLGLLVGWIFYFGATPLCATFTDDPLVLAQAVLYAQILAFSQVFVALEAVWEGVLAGAGDHRTITLLSVPLNVLRVPLAYGLAFTLGFGALGVWWAINLTSMMKAGFKGAAVWRGAWARFEV